MTQSSPPGNEPRASMLPAVDEVGPATAHGPEGNLLALTLGALGVVYGDIGTSPLYAINEIFYGRAAVERSHDAVVGAISLVLWTLTVVITGKYLTLVLRNDDDGEGGVFSLYSLLHRAGSKKVRWLLFLLILASGLLLGEGIITPAISVLSAVEGVAVVAPDLASTTVPITLVVLTALFAVQSRGTTSVGRLFSPIIIVWFLAIGVLGALEVARHPGILAAFDPTRGLRFLASIGPRRGLVVIGSVMLAITGGEALFADLGHFGLRPIRRGWYAFVYPALLASYLGQGAFLFGGQEAVRGNVFYALVPSTLMVPMVVLATAATVIASQALISGAFSLISQAVGLGLFPRVRIVHTHHAHSGQIYVPTVNWALFVGCVVLVVTFGSSTALASAYGLSVAGTMLTTSLSIFALSRLRAGWSLARTIAVVGPLIVIDLHLVAANSLKFFDGGYVPLALGVLLFATMVTWRWGRKATYRAYSGVKTMTLRELVALKESGDVPSVDRTVVLMVPKRLRSLEDNTPALLQLFLDRHGVLPRHLLFVEAIHPKVPYVHDKRSQVTTFEASQTSGSIRSATIRFGFMESPNVEAALMALVDHHDIDLPRDPHKWIVHVSFEAVHPNPRAGVFSRARVRVFMLLRRLSRQAHEHYGLGRDVQLTMEIVPVKLG